MDNIIQKIKARPKIAIGVGIGIVLLIIFNFVLGGSFSQTAQPSPKVSPQAGSSGNSANKATDSNPLSQVTPADNLSWLSYDSSGYTLSTPENWDIAGNKVEGGGTVVTFTPKEKPQDELFPRFSIEESTLKPWDMIQRRAKNLSDSYNLVQTQIVFRGNQAIKEEGILNIHFTGGNPLQKPVRKTLIFFNSASFSYVIEYSYFDLGDKASQNILERMVDSITFK